MRLLVFRPCGGVIEHDLAHVEVGEKTMQVKPHRSDSTIYIYALAPLDPQFITDTGDYCQLVVGGMKTVAVFW